jgi:hypothetical protein
VEFWVSGFLCFGAWCLWGSPEIPLCGVLGFGFLVFWGMVSLGGGGEESQSLVGRLVG